MFFTKQICFSLTFLNPWIHIADNIASVIGAYSSTRGDIGIGWERQNFPLFNNYLDYVFTFKDLLGLEKS